MTAKDVVRRFDIEDTELQEKLDIIIGDTGSLDNFIGEHTGEVTPESIVEAKVLGLNEAAGHVLVDIGGKAEAPIPLSEFEETGPPEPGQTFEVYYRGDDRHTNVPVVSKRDADRERAWTAVVGKYEPNNIIEGEVKKKIKGGLLVDLEGVLAFLPASQIDLRRTPEPADFIGVKIRAKIVMIDEERRNIVISRRQLLEEERMEKREDLLSEIAEGQVRKGEVKNIADFGAFVDLGGLDGLLHVTDMSYGRVKHPREVVRIGDVIDVFVLKIDRDRNRVALSLKALRQDPWEKITERYPDDSVHKGRIANIVPYGLFVELEPGVEGLVHVSELSWTRQNLNPEAEYEKGQEIEVMVKGIDLEKKEMSLSVREVEGNPWDRIAEHYPAGTVIHATVKNLASYGAFVEIEEGIDGLLHNSDMHWTRKIQHPSEMVHKGDRIECVVLNVDREKQRISLGMKQLFPNPWEDYIPANYHVGDVMAGTITKNIPSGCFVKLEEEVEAFLHYSSIPREFENNPEDFCIPGLKVEVRVVRVDCGEERIGLAFLHSDYPENDEIRTKYEEQKAKRKSKSSAKPQGSDDEGSGSGEPDGEGSGKKKSGAKAGEKSEAKAEADPEEMPEAESHSEEKPEAEADSSEQPEAEAEQSTEAKAESDSKKADAGGEAEEKKAEGGDAPAAESSEAESPSKVAD